MRMPSWKMSVAFVGTEPGVMPPTSWWWVIAALIAMGLPFEKMGITTYLHTPTPDLIRGALRSGCKRLILEGSEAGGHIGELGGIVLWQTATLEVLEALQGCLARPEESPGGTQQ